MDDVILVTGGAGFIGSHLVEALLHQGYTVRVLDDLSTGHLDNLRHLPSPPELIRASITDSDALDQALRNVRVVFHLAALASVARSMEQPVATHHACATGTLMLLDRARRQQVQRIVYAASSSAYGGLQGSDGAQSESLSVQPKSPYAAAKLAGELYLQAFGHAFGLQTVALRFFNIFGPRQRADSPYSGVIPLFIAAMLQGRSPTIYGDGMQSRDFTYVENAVPSSAAGSLYSSNSRPYLQRGYRTFHLHPPAGRCTQSYPWHQSVTLLCSAATRRCSLFLRRHPANPTRFGLPAYCLL
jgi:UDP-glucose 4-epimerase